MSQRLAITLLIDGFNIRGQLGRFTRQEAGVISERWVVLGNTVGNYTFRVVSELQPELEQK